MSNTDQDRRADALLRDARARIDAADAEKLLTHALGQSRGWLYAHGDMAVPDEVAARFWESVARRESGEPVAYLLGRRGFWRFDLAVTPDTLIPRPETELLVELALARIPAGVRCDVADLGTGSGAIAIAIASERPDAAVIACDRSEGALAVARANAKTLGCANVQFRRGDWWHAMTGERFDLVVSNPPYIATDDPHLESGDLRHEPRAALVSGADGLDAIRQILHAAGDHLHPGGSLFIEHGWQQGGAVRELFAWAGFQAIASYRDLAQHERVTGGDRPA